MLTNADYLTRPAFADRCRDVRADLEDGIPMTLGQIADRLHLPFEVFMDHVAGEIFKIDPSVEGVVIFEAHEDTVQ